MEVNSIDGKLFSCKRELCTKTLLMHADWRAVNIPCKWGKSLHWMVLISEIIVITICESRVLYSLPKEVSSNHMLTKKVLLKV